jgi:hypothetical protein
MVQECMVDLRSTVRIASRLIKSIRQLGCPGLTLKAQPPFVSRTTRGPRNVVIHRPIRLRSEKIV